MTTSTKTADVERDVSALRDKAAALDAQIEEAERERARALGKGVAGKALDVIEDRIAKLSKERSLAIDRAAALFEHSLPEARKSDGLAQRAARIEQYRAQLDVVEKAAALAREGARAIAAAWSAWPKNMPVAGMLHMLAEEIDEDTREFDLPPVELPSIVGLTSAEVGALMATGKDMVRSMTFIRNHWDPMTARGTARERERIQALQKAAGYR